MRSSSTQETTIGYDVLNEELFVDGTKSNAIDFHPDFAAKHQAPMKPERITLSIYVDWSSVEVFGNKGKTIVSDMIFPDLESRGLELYTLGGELKVVSLQINDLVSIWENETV
ncbi:GH32 C-terminal domain-containing protein [Paenibacillus polymyxa]|uniref:GH32 C-terminal domain-containing protein n=1 Tax=Paenibacillus polymyxa TaxID=1406 RepID=UPI000B250882|nr:GH32 C-terminal domain-containing protein [Paenibacillus polymyxa]